MICNWSQFSNGYDPKVPAMELREFLKGQHNCDWYVRRSEVVSLVMVDGGRSCKDLRQHNSESKSQITDSLKGTETFKQYQKWYKER